MEESSLTRHSSLDGRGMKGRIVSQVVPFLRHLSCFVCLDEFGVVTQPRRGSEERLAELHIVPHTSVRPISGL